MRIALLSALEKTDSGNPRAFLRIGGRTLLAWQADLAIALGCERIVCLSSGAVPEAIELQREIEARGVRFQLIRGPLQLVGLVSADQEILVLADGLVIDPALAQQIAGKTRAIAALPAEEGIAAGFERIDADRAWGGILVSRANIVERLADMPADADTISLLLRLALQSGTQVVLLDGQRLTNGELILASSDNILKDREKALLDIATIAVPWTAPGMALASRLTRKMAPDALAKGPSIGRFVGALSAIGALGLAASDYGYFALILMVISAVSLAISQLLSSLDQRLRGLLATSKLGRMIPVMFDLALVLVLAMPMTLPMVPQRVFLPLIVIGLLRLAERQLPKRLAALASDRILLALVLVPAARFDVTTSAIAIISLITLGLLIVNEYRSRITAG